MTEFGKPVVKILERSFALLQKVGDEDGFPLARRTVTKLPIA